MTKVFSMPANCITFGLFLDGQRATQPVNSLGVAVVGPAGFLDILEMQLGLQTLYPSQAERVVQYRNCLHQLDGDERFYHRSFAIDPLGTAAHLLAWRDHWILHGWSGAMPAQAPKRLQDLADIETLASTAVSANTGQRLQAVHAAFQYRNSGIGQVRLLDPLENFPARWRTVLAELPNVTLVQQQVGQGEGFLGSLQQKLQSAVHGHGVTKLDWIDDGSVLVVQAETSLLANRWLAGQLATPVPTLLVCGVEGMRVDAQLAAAGLPRHGLKQASLFRPAQQVLPLALELLWDPLNYYGLVQFLTHPVCPVPGWARRRLAQKIADAPGIGGGYWQRTLDAIAEHYGPEKAPEVQEQIAFWIEHQRFSAELGAPLEAVMERTARLKEFFRVRLGVVDSAQRSAFLAGYGQCKACLDALLQLHAQGSTLIRPKQLRKLVSQATTIGYDNHLWPAEVGAGLVVNDPGAVAEPVDRVIWSPLAMPVLPGNDPWSSSELAALQRIGVVLPSASERLDRIAATWLRPVMAACKQLVLVLPAQGSEVHPLWQMINAVAKAPKVLSLEAFLSSGGEAFAPVSPQPLPAPQRWWQLPAHVQVNLRPKESFSSLEKLLFNPYQWLLQYPAKLQPSRTIGLGGDFRILGNLAHKLVEQYFLHPHALSMEAAPFDTWFASSFDALVDQEGAILKSPGRGADLEGFRYRLQNSLGKLREQVIQAAVVHVEPERAVCGTFPGGELAGFIDLVMRTERQDCVIVDMKWSGSKKFPEKLRANRHLQLAIYAELLRQHSGDWPSVAYYILDKAQFFTPAPCAFPDAKVVPSDSGENTAQLWQRFLATWRWRVAQIQAGRFEVVHDSIAEDDASKPPEDAMAMEVLNPNYNEYRTLAGWGC